MPAVPPNMQLGSGQKYCPACGWILAAAASSCSRCGAPQEVPVQAGVRPRSRLAAILLAFFLGGVGTHRFYLGRWRSGLAYLLLAFTLVPSILALVDFVRYLVMDEAEFQRRYAGKGGGPLPAVISALAFFFAYVPLTGITAALAIPAFVLHHLRGKAEAVVEQTRTLGEAELSRVSVGAPVIPVAGVPRRGPLGGQRRALDEQEADALRSLTWDLGDGTYGLFSVAVEGKETAPQAFSICAETDLDGDSHRAAVVFFHPVKDGDQLAVMPPPAPCRGSVQLAKGVTLEFQPGYPTDEPVPVSPPGVF
jgi:TM2 domain-containing membrane protein YozV